MSPRVTGRVGRGNPAGAPAAGLTADSLLFAATTCSVQDFARDTLGRELSADELEWVAQRMTIVAGEALDTLVGSLPKADSPSSLAERLLALAAAIDGLGEEHCARLSFESYTGLSENAAELKAVANAIVADDLGAVVAKLIAEGEEHLRNVREFCEEGGEA
jgi:hypothetical protein